ncbi:hypothetical protein Tco_0278012 [Tanacetum coccineum]
MQAVAGEPLSCSQKHTWKNGLPSKIPIESLEGVNWRTGVDVLRSGGMYVVGRIEVSLFKKRVAATLYSMQALLRAQLAVRSQRAHRSFKDHRVQPEIRHQKSTERFDNDTRSEIHSKRLSTSHDSIKNSYDESPKIAGMDPYRPHGQSRRNHYQDPERGFTGKDYKCSKTTRSTPRVAYSNIQHNSNHLQKSL